MRTFRAVEDVDGVAGPVEWYKFYHPMTGMGGGVTTFHRQDLEKGNWETAGEIDWSSNYNATVAFGATRISIRELRRPKKSSSKSRRFQASGSEYKWKIAENGTDLFCVDSRGKTVATWTQELLTLQVARRVEGILDRIVVTCLLHLWIRQLGHW